MCVKERTGVALGKVKNTIQRKTTETREKSPTVIRTPNMIRLPWDETRVVALLIVGLFFRCVLLKVDSALCEGSVRFVALACTFVFLRWTVVSGHNHCTRQEKRVSVFFELFVWTVTQRAHLDQLSNCSSHPEARLRTCCSSVVKAHRQRRERRFRAEAG